jgi:hypothetical protein
MRKLDGNVRVIVGVASLALLLAGVFSLVNRPHSPVRPATLSMSNAVAVHSAAVGGLDPRARTCAGQGPVIGAVGVLRTGESGPARAALGPAVATQVRDTVLGDLVFYRPGPGTESTQLSSVFARVGTVHAQAARPALHTCDMLLSNRPADRPLVAAALRAVVARHLAASASRLRTSVQEILVSDNPLRAGSVIVTLLLPGPARAPISRGAPKTHSLNPVTVIMSYPGARVSGVARGGL